jgi:hypothetical protein
MTTPESRNVAGKVSLSPAKERWRFAPTVSSKQCQRERCQRNRLTNAGAKTRLTYT